MYIVVRGTRYEMYKYVVSRTKFSLQLATKKGKKLKKKCGSMIKD